MKVASSITITPGVTGPDPVSNPEDVPEGALLRVPERRSPFDTPVMAVYLALAAAAGETVTVEVWALDEGTAGLPLADRRFYRTHTGLVLTAHQLAVLSVYPAAWSPMPSGPLYIRQTADTLAAAATLGAVPV